MPDVWSGVCKFDCDLMLGRLLLSHANQGFLLRVLIENWPTQDRRRQDIPTANPERRFLATCLTSC
jgi:hypothetical protein